MVVQITQLFLTANYYHKHESTHKREVRRNSKYKHKHQ